MSINSRDIARLAEAVNALGRMVDNIAPYDKPATHTFTDAQIDLIADQIALACSDRNPDFDYKRWDDAIERVK